MVKKQGHTTKRPHSAQDTEEGALLDGLLSISPFGVCITDEEGVFVEVNQTYCDIYAYSRKELIGQNFTIIAPEAYREELQKQYDASLKEGKTPPQTYDLRTKDGRAVTVRVTTQVVHAPTGRKLKLTTVQDITDQAQVKEEKDRVVKALKERVKEQHCLYQITNLSHFDYSADELLQRAVEIIPGGWQYPHLATAVIEYQGKQYASSKHKITKWCQKWSKPTDMGHSLNITVCYAQAVPDREGDMFLQEETALLEAIANELLLNLRQITAREEVEHHRDELQRIMDASMDLIITLDPQGHFQRVNAASKQILGYAPEELIGRSNMEFVLEEDRKKTEEMAAKLTEQPRVGYFENRYIHADGHAVPLIWSTTYDKENKIVYAIARDASDLRKAEREIDLLINNTDESYILMDKDLRILSVNKQFRTLYKRFFGIEVVKGENILEYAQSERREIVRAIYDKVLDGEEVQSEISVPDGQGSERIIHLKYSPARDHYQKIVGAFVTASDITERRRAEEQLQLSERRFRSLVQSGADLTAILDWKGNYLYITPNYPQIIGFDEDDLIGRNGFDFFHPEDKERVMGEFAQLKDKKRVNSSPYRFRHKDGHYRWVRSVGTNMMDDPDIQGIVVNSVDITDLVQIQDEIRKSEEKIALSEKRFRALVENGADALVVLSAEGQPTYVSPSITRVLGYTEQEAMSLNLFALLHPDDAPYVLKRMEAVLASPGVPMPGHTSRTRHKDGSWRWLEATITNMLHDPDIKGIVDNFRDVTERIEAEQRLFESEAYLREAQRLAKMGSWNFDFKNDRLTWSDALYDVFGVDRETFLETHGSFVGLVEPEYQELVRSTSTRTQKTGEPFNIQYRITTPAGERKIIEEFGYGEKDEKGKVIRLFGTAQDVTERELSREWAKIENELMEASIRDNEHIEEQLLQYLRGLEQFFPALMTSILRVHKGRIYNLASPSLPAKYIAAINGEPIGPKAGSCGTAAYTGERVIVSDVMTDPRWEAYWHLAEGFGIGACWSQPIFDSEHNVIATFANYSAQPKEPSGEELRVFERSASLVSIVLEKYTASNALQASNARYELVNMATDDAIYDWDIENDRFDWGESFYRVLGHPRETGTFSLEDWVSLMHPSDSQKNEADWQDFMTNKKRSRWHKEFRFRRANGSYAHVEEIGNLIRDKKGKPVRMIGVIRDITEQKKLQVRKEVEQKIAEIFKTAESTFKALQETLVYLAGLSDYPVGEYWMYSHEDHRLHQTNRFGLAEYFGFFKKTKDLRAFARGEGMPGTILDLKRPHYWDIIEPFHDFQYRAPAASSMGLKWTVGIPVFVDEVVGVLQFWSIVSKADDIIHHEIITGIGGFLGMELRRKQQEEEFRLLFESAPEIMAIAAPRGRFVKVNPAFCRLTGFSEDELTSIPFSELIHPADLERTIAEFEENITGRKANAFVNRYRTKSGKYIWISWNSSDKFGEEGYMFAFGRDVTEIVKLQGLLDNASQIARVGGWEVDVLTDTHYWSPMTKEIHEVPADFQAAGMDEAIGFYKEDMRSFVVKSVQQAIDTGQPFDFEAILVTAKGNERWVRAKGEAEFEDGKCVRIYGSFQDIHDRKSAELLLQNLTDNIPGVIFRYHLLPDGTNFLRHVSKGAQAIWGLTPEEVMEDSSKLWALVWPEDADDMQRTIMASATNGIKWDHKFRIRHPSKTIRWLHGHATPQYSPDGSIRWDTAIFDVTEQKNLEELLESSSRMAMVGSWEIDVPNMSVYWSDITKEIREVGPDFEPTLDIGLSHFLEGHDRDTIQRCVKACMEQGTPWDEELRIITFKGNVKWIRTIGKAEFIDGKCVRIYGSFQDINEKKTAELALARKTEFLTAVAVVIGIFLQKEDWEQTLESCFTLVGEVVGADRMYYFENYPDMETGMVMATQKYEWNRGTAPSHANDPLLKEFPLQAYEEIYGEMIVGVPYMARLADTPPSNVRSLFEAQQIKSTVSVPIFIEGHFFGFVGFDDCTTGREWSEDEISFLQTITANLGAAIQRTRSKEQLEKAYDERNQMLERIAEGFFALDREWTVIYWNKVAEDLIGIQRSELVGHNLWEKFPLARDLKFFSEYERAFREQVPVFFEEFYPELGKWFEARGYPSPEGISVFFRDITEKKRTEEEVRASNERFEKVTEATNDAIWDWDIATDTTYYGGGFRTLFGYDSEKLAHTTHSWTDHIHAEDREFVVESLERVLSNPDRTNWQCEYRFIKHDGSLAFVVDRGVVIRNVEGHPLRMVGAMTDITHRKEYEDSLRFLNETLDARAKELANTNAELEQFAYVASHDLQEPLRMVTGFLTQLEKRYGEVIDDKGKQYIQFAVDGAKRMRQIILDLLEFSRAGRMEGERSDIPLREVLDEVCLLQKENIEEKGAIINYTDLPVVHTYSTPLVQIFQNLIGNALKYSREGVPPRIDVKVKETKDEWVVSVSDNGIGIEEEYFQKIFVIFQRLHLKDAYGGSGLGLAIVKKLVENIGGKIWLESKVGEGSTFYFTIRKEAGQ